MCECDWCEWCVLSAVNFFDNTTKEFSWLQQIVHGFYLRWLSTKKVLCTHTKTNYNYIFTGRIATVLQYTARFSLNKIQKMHFSSLFFAYFHCAFIGCIFSFFSFAIIISFFFFCCFFWIVFFVYDLFLKFTMWYYRYFCFVQGKRGDSWLFIRYIYLYTILNRLEFCNLACFYFLLSFQFNSIKFVCCLHCLSLYFCFFFAISFEFCYFILIF